MKTAFSIMVYYYYPLLPNGKVAPLVWQIRLFNLNINWPIAEESAAWKRAGDKVVIALAFLVFCLSNEAELLYILEWRHNIGMALEGLATYLILVEVHFRVFNMAFHKQSFRTFIGEFFQEIYIDRAIEPKIYQKIQRNLIFTKLVTLSYIGTVVTYFAIPLLGLLNGRHLLPFKMSFHYDFTPWHIYLPTLVATLWLGCAVVTHLAVEVNLLAMVIMHLNARYLLLQRDILELHAKLSRNSPPNEEVLRGFREGLIGIIKRNVELNEFGKKLQAQYSFCIFTMMAFSAVLLCVLGFKAVTLGMSSKNITYVTWILGKIIELVVFGELGSTLVHTTNRMSSMYYQSNWEDVILNSSASRENAAIMKLIAMSIELNQKPLYLTGYNFFYVSLPAVIAILQGAGSYFTCLYAFR